MYDFLDKVEEIIRTKSCSETLHYINSSDANMDNFVYPVDKKTIPFHYPFEDFVYCLIRGLEKGENTFFKDAKSIVYKFYKDLIQQLRDPVFIYSWGVQGFLLFFNYLYKYNALENILDIKEKLDNLILEHLEQFTQVNDSWKHAQESMVFLLERKGIEREEKKDKAFSHYNSRPYEFNPKS